jgi:hypothetical protein
MQSMTCYQQSDSRAQRWLLRNLYSQFQALRMTIETAQEYQTILLVRCDIAATSLNISTVADPGKQAVHIAATNDESGNSDVVVLGDVAVMRLHATRLLHFNVYCTSRSFDYLLFTDDYYRQMNLAVYDMPCNLTDHA